jgi:hypothetical protein
MNLNQYIGKNQLRVLHSCLRGEEKEFFRQMIDRLKSTIAGMPVTYETDGQGDEAVAVLHYFNGSSDWWIIERDVEDEQLQAFGFTCLNGWTDSAELGYISIQELIENNVELDLYWHPKTLGEIKMKLAA